MVGTSLYELEIGKLVQASVADRQLVNSDICRNSVHMIADRYVVHAVIQWRVQASHTKVTFCGWQLVMISCWCLPVSDLL